MADFCETLGESAIRAAGGLWQKGARTMDCGRRNTLISIALLVVAGLCSAILPTNAQVNVIQHHNHGSRDGLYIDSAFTPSAAANLTRDTNFNGTVSGNIYAQPLYIEGGPGGRAMIIAVTESNNVYALDAITGTVIWQRNVGPPVASGLPCGNISPLGITGTPVVDLSSRSLFFDAMIDGPTKKHFVYSLNVDNGATNPGWPVDVNAAAAFNGTSFTSLVQNERGALGLVNGRVYVPYGGHAGDCGTYHGWLVGVLINNPAGVRAWATSAIGGGAWGVGGVASDGNNPFITTGNTFSTGGIWSGGEAVIRFQPGPIFTGNVSDYWAPTNWLSLDNGDVDLGGSGPLLVQVPGATPSSLVVQFGKDANVYLLNRANLGGISAPAASGHVSNNAIIQAAAAYHTNQGAYVVFRASGSTLTALRIGATSPPTIITAWSVSPGSGCGSPFVTDNTIVWVVANATGGQRLHGYDANTGTVVYGGGGPNELMTGAHSYNTTGIAARGHIYIATDNKVYAFRSVGTVGCPTNPNTDFNHDDKPDYVLYNGGTLQTGLWYMNNNVFVSGAYGPTLPAGWKLIDVADFSGDGNLDYALFNPVTRQTAIWYLSGVRFVGGAYGPTLPSGWALMAVGDFNADCRPDYVLYNASTHRTAIWYMNNNIFVSAAFGPTLPVGWGLAGVADFNGDGKRDYLLVNASTRQSAIWYLSGVTFLGSAFGPTIAAGYTLIGPADFNVDGNPDYLLYNASTRQTAIWYLNNNFFVSGAFGPTLAAGWSLVGP